LASAVLHKFRQLIVRYHSTFTGAIAPMTLQNLPPATFVIVTP